MEFIQSETIKNNKIYRFAIEHLVKKLQTQSASSPCIRDLYEVDFWTQEDCGPVLVDEKDLIQIGHALDYAPQSQTVYFTEERVVTKNFMETVVRPMMDSFIKSLYRSEESPFKRLCGMDIW